MASPNYDFFREIGRILNGCQSRSIVLTGNIFDWFFLEEANKFVPLLDFMMKSWDVGLAKNLTKIVWRVNGPIKFMKQEDQALVKNAWIRLMRGDEETPAFTRLARPYTAPTKEEQDKIDKEFEDLLMKSSENRALGLEILRQMCMASRTMIDGKSLLEKKLMIIIEAADILIPPEEIARLQEADRRKIGICRDWFSDPGFMQGADSVILLSESRSKLNQEVSRLPQLVEVNVPSPNKEQRLHYINWFLQQRKVELYSNSEELASATAGLSILAIEQLLKEAAWSGKKMESSQLVKKVEEFLKSQIGEDVVEFSRPKHNLNDAVGFTNLKKFLREKLIPRVKLEGKGCISGAAVAGPLGSGKTFIFEAMAAELGIPVLVLKNLRSMWYGQTDVIFERLRRVLEVLDKVLIFVDEADTQMGGVGENVHETERRLTGKIQAMMSDPELKGRVVWLLMTARINQLSPDIRRPGRAGDMIIPVLDPEGDDQKAFVVWMLKPVMESPDEQTISELTIQTKGYSSAAFTSLREELTATAILNGKPLTKEQVLDTIKNRLSQDIGLTRQIQILYALLNCTHRELLPEEYKNQDLNKARETWRKDLIVLEAMV